MLSFLQRAGISKFNRVFEFPYNINGKNVNMAVTSVLGHLMEGASSFFALGFHELVPFNGKASRLLLPSSLMLVLIIALN